MSANLAIGGGVILAILIFIVWLARSNKKAGRQEADNERASQYAEDISAIHDMERIQDEKDKPDFGDTDTARDYLSGRVRDKNNKR